MVEAENSSISTAKGKMPDNQDYNLEELLKKMGSEGVTPERLEEFLLQAGKAMQDKPFIRMLERNLLKIEGGGVLLGTIFTMLSGANDRNPAKILSGVAVFTGALTLLLWGKGGDPNSQVGNIIEALEERIKSENLNAEENDFAHRFKNIMSSETAVDIRRTLGAAGASLLIVSGLTQKTVRPFESLVGALGLLSQLTGRIKEEPFDASKHAEGYKMSIGDWVRDRPLRAAAIPAWGSTISNIITALQHKDWFFLMNGIIGVIVNTASGLARKNSTIDNEELAEGVAKLLRIGHPQKVTAEFLISVATFLNGYSSIKTTIPEMAKIIAAHLPEFKVTEEKIEAAWKAQQLLIANTQVKSHSSLQGLSGVQQPSLA